MAYQICDRCSKMFEKNKERYCKPCSEKNAKDYALVTEYINKYPQATVLEIIKETGAELKSIDCFIKDGSMSEKKYPKGLTT